MVRDGWALAYRRYSTDYVDEEGEAQRHTGVVCPLSGFEAKRTTANHVSDMLVAVSWFELQRSPNGITYSEAHEAADSPITGCYFGLVR